MTRREADLPRDIPAMFVYGWWLRCHFKVVTNSEKQSGLRQVRYFHGVLSAAHGRGLNPVLASMVFIGVASISKPAGQGS